MFMWDFDLNYCMDFGDFLKFIPVLQKATFHMVYYFPYMTLLEYSYKACNEFSEIYC